MVFDQAEQVGYDLKLLDIGGGFTGRFDASGEVFDAIVCLNISFCR